MGVGKHSGDIVSGRSRHHQHFRGLHRNSMAVAQIDKTRFTHHNGNGSSAARTLQEALHLPKQSWWSKYFKWENNLTVAGKTVEKGWVVPQQLGIAMIVVVLGVVGWAYKSGTADQRETRDSIIRMETMLNERTQTIKEQQAKFEEQLETEKRIGELQREQQNDKLRDMKAALSQKGIIVTKE